jgi:pimeloyl-ACP methyl ester carboxylesterase
MLLSILLIVSIFYIVITALLYFFQSRFVYFPDKQIIYTPAQIGLCHEDVFLTTTDGLKLHGWFISVEKDSATVLFCHGNAGNISHRLESIQVFAELGLNVFIFDYRGYGQSAGHPDEIGTYTDASAAWEYLIKERSINPDQIIIFGRSLGCGIAAWLAKEKNPSCLILESSFTSIVNLGKKYYPFLPVKWMSRIHYPVSEYVRNIHCSKLFIHSSEDELIPFDHGEKNFKIAAEPKDFLEIRGSHNDGFVVSRTIYMEGMRNFLLKSKSDLLKSE